MADQCGGKRKQQKWQGESENQSDHSHASDWMPGSAKRRRYGNAQKCKQQPYHDLAVDVAVSERATELVTSLVQHGHHLLWVCLDDHSCLSFNGRLD
jgi:hypothetical protein